MVQRELPGQVGRVGRIHRLAVPQSADSVDRPSSEGGRASRTSQWKARNSSRSAPARVNPTWADMRLQHTSGDADYHGLTVGLQKRLSRGFDGQFSYTYATADRSGLGRVEWWRQLLPGAADGHRLLGPLPRLQPVGVRHPELLYANFTYQLPGDNLTGFVGALAKGWRVNGILMITDGFPLSVSGADDRGHQASRQCRRVACQSRSRRATTTPCWAVPIITSTRPSSRRSRRASSARRAAQFADYAGIGDVRPGLLEGLPGVRRPTIDPVPGGSLQPVQPRELRYPQHQHHQSNGMPNPNVGRITSTRTTARQIQLGLRFVF